MVFELMLRLSLTPSAINLDTWPIYENLVLTLDVNILGRKT